MYPFIKYGKTISKAVFKERKGDTLKFDEVSSITFRCNASDIDNFMEMNNGRIITLFDLGRTDLAIRTGLGYQLIKNRWGLVVAGSTIQYRKRIRLGDEVTLKTRVIGREERWIYIEQSMWVKGQACSSAILRTGITSKGKVIESIKVLQSLGHSELELPHHEFLQAWIEADKLRPWPPQF